MGRAHCSVPTEVLKCQLTNCWCDLSGALQNCCNFISDLSYSDRFLHASTHMPNQSNAEEWSPGKESIQLHCDYLPLTEGANFHLRSNALIPDWNLHLGCWLQRHQMLQLQNYLIENHMNCDSIDHVHDFLIWLRSVDWTKCVIRLKNLGIPQIYEFPNSVTNY